MVNAEYGDDFTDKITLFCAARENIESKSIKRCQAVSKTSAKDDSLSPDALNKLWCPFDGTFEIQNMETPTLWLQNFQKKLKNSPQMHCDRTANGHGDPCDK